MSVAIKSNSPSDHRIFAAIASAALSTTGLGLDSCLAQGAPGGSEAFTVSEAWVSPNDALGSNVPLLMTIKNNTDSADTLLRVRCPVANFSERHTVDRGEGAPAMRSIPSIPIAANGTTTFKADGYHIMLLQTRQALNAGDTFKCAIVFQKAGTIETEVTVRK